MSSEAPGPDAAAFDLSDPIRENARIVTRREALRGTDLL